MVSPGIWYFLSTLLGLTQPCKLVTWPGLQESACHTMLGRNDWLLPLQQTSFCIHVILYPTTEHGLTSEGQLVPPSVAETQSNHELQGELSAGGYLESLVQGPHGDVKEPAQTAPGVSLPTLFCRSRMPSH